ncbi:MAG: LptF/LptG family permease [Phycisphaerae bacterium]|nr:LptF/LptG family permease [Phycisphaerae bacterium]
MPGILYRHILLELLKVLIVTTTVLVTVIAFGAAIKPLAENLLGPADLLKYIAYATIPMMQFALPFSAAFAGTIVYHRLTVDNEIVAMAASGIPYRRILLPAVGLGVVLTIVMVVLVDVGVPTFWQAMKRVASRDVTRLLAAQVNRGEAYVPDEAAMEIYADEAILTEAPANSGAAQRLLLFGVVVVEVDVLGNPITEFTAERAMIDNHRVNGNSYLKTLLSGATVFKRGDNSLVQATTVRPEAFDFERSVVLGPKGLTFAELWRLRHDLTRSEAIRELRTNLVQALASVEAWQCIADSVSAGEILTLRGTGEAARYEFDIVARKLVGTTLLSSAVAGPAGELSDPVIIRQYQLVGSQREQMREITAPRITLSAGSSLPEGLIRFQIEAESATVRDTRTRSGGVQRSVRLGELELQRCAIPDRSAMAPLELADLATQRSVSLSIGPHEALRDLLAARVSQLVLQMDKLSDEIMARFVQRISQAATAILMLMTGSILAILLRQRLPLFVYTVAFLPAIIDILLISGGEQMLKSRGLSMGALFVAFSGNFVLIAVCIYGAWRIRKH